MTTLYIDLGERRLNTSPYETWEKAAPDLSVVDSLVAASDTIYMDFAHSEDDGVSLTNREP